MNKLCPCGSNHSAEGCCQMIIAGRRDAVTAQELMRSRYVAFTRANGDYLMQSHHSETRQMKERKNIEQWAKSVQWMGLVILKIQGGESKDQIGYVEFRALYLENGQMLQIHENSFFKRENGKWVYHSGIHL